MHKKSSDFSIEFEEKTVLIRFKKTIILVVILEIFLQQSAVAKDNIEKSGDIAQVIIPAIAYGATFYLDDKDGRLQFYKSFVSNLAVTHGLKFTIDAKRPNGGKHSFPSGHTSAAFQGAAFIHKRYGLKYAIPAYIGATFVGYSRIESKNHYTRDVIAGAVIGTLNSFYFTTKYKGYTISPTAKNGSFGLSISKKW